MNARLQEKIAGQQDKIKEFIDKMRTVFSATPDASEKANRLEVFNTLLLLATYADTDELENEFRNVLPKNDTSDTINYMCRQLQEINGFCKGLFSDEHEVYQDLFRDITYPTQEIKQAIRTLLSEAISTKIFEKTDTEIDTNSMRYI